MVYVFIAALILLNGLFSMSEIALVSSRRSKLRELARKKKTGAKAALYMAQRPVIFFSTVQVGITLVGVILGALGDRALAPAFAGLFRTLPLADTYQKTLSFIFTVGLLTYTTLIIGELVPKRIAVANPEAIATGIAPLIRVIYLLTYPLIRFFGKSTELVLRFLKVRSRPEAAQLRDETKAMADKSGQEELGGSIDMVYFNNLPVNTFMTPRTAIQWFDIDTYSHRDLRSHYGTYPYSQVIFCSESLDHVVGVIHFKELLRRYLDDPDFNIKRAVRQPPVFNEKALALEVLDKLGSSPAQIALIQDCDGKTKGMVTPDDIMRACMKNGRYSQPTA